VKRCEYCGHDGLRMAPVTCRWTGRIKGWKCYHPVACIRRQERAGQWFGKRVLRRVDRDGTRWHIKRAGHELVSSSGEWFVLTCEYREHRMTSWHTTIDQAKAHANEMVRSCESTSLRQFARGR
jgi:hypothetical protein